MAALHHELGQPVAGQRLELGRRAGRRRSRACTPWCSPTARSRPSETYAALNAARVRSASAANSDASSAQHGGRLRQHSRRAVQARGRHHAGVGLGGPRLVRRRVRVEPVAELEPLVPHPVLRHLRRHPAHVRAHRVVLPLEHRRVAVRLVQRPRHPHRRVAPQRGRVHRRQPRRRRHPLEHVGHHERHHAVGVLLLERRGRPASPRGTPTRRRGTPPRARTPRGRRSSRAARCAAGSPWGRRGSSPAAPRPRCGAAGSAAGRSTRRSRCGAGRSGRRPPRASRRRGCLASR